MKEMFKGALVFRGNGIMYWDTSSVTSMYEMFCNAQAFDTLLDNWNTENVQTMSGMFKQAYAYDRQLSFNT